MSGTDLARQFPGIAARLVVNPDANQANAWDVLVSAFGTTMAKAMVRNYPNGPETLVRLGVA